MFLNKSYSENRDNVHVTCAEMLLLLSFLIMMFFFLIFFLISPFFSPIVFTYLVSRKARCWVEIRLLQMERNADSKR